MANLVIMPRQGQSVESCVITGFGKQVGDHVGIGDVLFSYETDKAAFEEEAKVEGTLLAIFFSEGDDVPCLETVCVIGEAGEDISALAPSAAEKAPVPAPAANAETPAAPVEQPAQVAVKIAGQAEFSSKISPRARRAAESLLVNPALASATGPDGRVIERDILALSASGAGATSAAHGDYLGAGVAGGTGIGGRFSTADIGAARNAETTSAPVSSAAKDVFVDEPLSNMRKLIAKAMFTSLSTMAQLTHNSSFDASAILDMRAEFKKGGTEFEGITINDMVLYAVSRVLADPEHRALNAHYLDDKMRYFGDVNLGIAVDTPRGLMVPTLFSANVKSLKQISAEAKALAKACIAGNVSPDNLQGGTFTVSNLGALGIESFTPVINPPQTGILGVNTITHRVRADGSVYPAMALSLTYDHRALDGAPASRFLRDLNKRLENFRILLALG